ncbi:MAG: T9SS type A sorting domain-containing protein [Bacteroidota bacterium]
MKIAWAVSSVVLLLSSSVAFCQKNVGPLNKPESLKNIKPIVCYSAVGDANTYVPPPARYLAWRKNQSARTKTSTIIVTYDGFSQEAKDAFQAAVDIWETLIISTVPIHISASWISLDDNVLGAASPGSYFRNFDGAQKIGCWYPVSMAEKISHQELNVPTEADIVASFNSDNVNWSFDTQGIVTAGKYDMVSVVLHEIGHGLGITHSYEVSGGNGQIQDFFDGNPLIFESFLENQTPTNLVTGFSAPSTDLADQLTGGSLFFNSPLVLSANDSLNGIIYAPSTYNAGSSIAHLDENSYPRGDQNSLMTPSLNSAEIIYDPGPITLGILKDMGWNTVFIQHIPIASTEDLSTDFPVVCQIKSDTMYNASSLKLSYTSDGTTFTSKTMTPTANTNEFQSSIPKTGATVTYGYYLSLTDTTQRTFVKPGLKYVQGTSAIDQSLFVFTAGPDSQPPHITHSPKGFIQNTEVKLKLEAIVMDNISVKKVEIEYLINNIAQTKVVMLNTKDSTYEATITIAGGLFQGDKIKYRIKATDNAVALNSTTIPSAADYFTVNVVSLAAIQDSYSNDFNSASNDFFGDPEFSITTPSGFTDGAIHSVHPYPNGSGANFESNFVYQLRVPIKLKPSNATIKFDEIVLAEPGENGSVFGSADFFDYVIVEGSIDGGISWKPFVDGYDSRAQAAWLIKWNSSSDSETQPNSTAAGDLTLFISRTINMLGNKTFFAGDEVVVRFRLFADQLVHGWGWAVDNLKIQIDDSAPVILHDHTDFLLSTATSFSIETNVTDDGGLKDLSVEYSVNNGVVTNLPLSVTPDTDQYILDLALKGLATGDEIQYRIKATDVVNNVSILPATGFFHVPLLDFGSTLTMYVSDFNSVNTDFVGNFFSITKPVGFSDGAIHSSHPYGNGFGLENTSSFDFILKKPVVIDATNPRISFDEIALTEFSGATIKDVVVVEGSKDQGVTWEPLLDPYAANAEPDWAVAFVSKEDGSPSLFKNRIIDITKSGKLKAGDAVLFRFRLTTNAAVNSWGWAIDNLSIQGPITGIENTMHSVFQVYPNPVSSDYFTISLPPKFEGAKISVINLQGQSILNTIYLSNAAEQKIFVGNVVDGMYLVRVNSEIGVLTSKIVVKR